MRTGSGPDRIGRYEVIGLLGTGAFAAVHLASDPALDAEVAIKVLADHHSVVPDIRRRFIDEARVLRRLASDRIVTVHDIGERNGQPYVVMEVIRGGTLEDRLGAIAPSPHDLMRLVSEMGACMDAVHRGGVVHRDIKPSNLLIRPARDGPTGGDAEVSRLIGPEERLVLADFGLARALGLTTLTVAGGTDGFVAPEQRSPNTTIDERADVFAASAVIASAVHGSMSESVRAAIDSSVRPVDRALAIGMAEAPHERHASATEWSAALRSALVEEFGEATGGDDGGTDVAAPTNATADSDLARPSPRRPRWMIGVGVVVAVAVLLAGLALARRSDSTSDTADSALDATQSSGPVAGGAEPVAGNARIDAFAGGWSTDGASIVDSTGQRVDLRAVDWGGFDTAFGAPLGLWERNWRDVVDQIAELGFNTINLPFSSDVLAEGTMPSEDLDTTLNPDLAGMPSIEIMDQVIGYAATKGLAVVLERRSLDADSDEGASALWYDAEHPRRQFLADWQFVAERYQDVANVVGADLAGAPHFDACWGCGDEAVDWKAAAETGGNAIHEIVPEWLILVAGVATVDGGECLDEAGDGCAWWGSDLSGAVDDPVVLDQANKVVYAPLDYATSVGDQPWFDSPDFPDDLPAVWNRFWGDLVRSGDAPVVVGFGSTLENQVDTVWMETLLEYLDDNGVGFSYRSLSPSGTGPGGLLGDDWTTVDRAKSTILDPYLSGPFR